jgi:hypothetical protein
MKIEGEAHEEQLLLKKAEEIGVSIMEMQVIPATFRRCPQK